MNAKSQPEPADEPAKTFEEGLSELEAIVRRLEEGELPLAQSLADYAQGVAMLKHCFQILESAERKIELLQGLDAEGNPQTESFDDTSLSLEEKSQVRSQRRSRGQ